MVEQVAPYEMDWDYYEYGAEELEQEKAHKGIVKFIPYCIYKSAAYKDQQFCQIDFSTEMKDLIEFGAYQKDSMITKYSPVIKFSEQKKSDLPEQLIQQLSKFKISDHAIKNSPKKEKKQKELPQNRSKSGTLIQ